MTSEEEFLKTFKRFFKLFVPAYFSNGVMEFLSAGFNILVSNEFYRVTLGIIKLTLIIYVNILGIIYGEFEENNENKKINGKVVDSKEKESENKMKESKKRK
jgi:hypothetical protein